MTQPAVTAVPRDPLIEPRDQTFGSVTDRVVRIPLEPIGRGWLLALGGVMSIAMLGLTAIAWVIVGGVGVWGINIPVAWGFAIINFVWWIGIGHAGTLISAILLLLKQDWRNSINRFAEAMTLFAVAMAGMFPLLHLGRIGRFYYLLPYPNTMELWPQWRSPLVWDVFAVFTYGTVSLIFWYLGLVPDLAAMRDRCKRPWVGRLVGFFALGWTGEVRQWQRYKMIYLVLAGLATPLVVSVHSIVSLDFSVAIVPGWHSTIFPPYFVAGAIFSGFAMVITLLVPIRRIFHFKDVITRRHLNNLGKLMLVSGLVVSYGYIFEFFNGWLSGDAFEISTIREHFTGYYALTWWIVFVCNVLAPQLLWFQAVRRHALLLFAVAQFVNVGMWVERYMIVVPSLHHDYLPAAFGIYHATFWDWALLSGTIGIFIMLILLFVRFVPMISVHEVRELMQHQLHRPKPPRRPEQRPEPQRLAREVPLYGVVAEFEAPDDVVAAARAAREQGYERVQVHSHLPLEDLPEAVGRRKSRVGWVMFAGGILGGSGAYLMQWYAAVLDYPWNIGGRPLHSWPSFIPLTFELTVLGASLAGFAAFFVANRFPQLHQPVFNDPEFDRAAVAELLRSHKPLRVAEVPQ